ncbi:RNA polymerase sigma factor [Rhizobium wenxiniae]|uniref:RNA polymerase sigma-70 factor (ECF subfamily) n=1 Tax=Rhizobium wenxiniae TaxID=1737357 RepID=A0A7W9YCE0_9HYPH|nr:sigma-70 family RNA polymerase sigma factor [Rhizobium wenxiniae]MBB6165138.1 RNA polymerase sigma-70 factor (ECF subfamily) [Rhizobium wenxiniae]GGG13071.1 RNA polymerase sigma factor [Rhizobium wenxiniae]
MRSIGTDDAIQAEMVQTIPALRNFATRFVRDRSEVDDLVQETLTRGLANIDKFQPGTRLRSWMFTIMRNTFCTGYHRGRREVAGLDDCVSLQASVPPAQEWGVRMQEFSEAVARLSPEHRKAFNMVLMDGLSYETAASCCGCPVGTIKSRVSRIRLALAQQTGGVW